MIKKRARAELNLMELVPVRRLGHISLDGELVAIEVPRFKSEWARRLFLPRRRKPTVQVRLDAMGSFVWGRCDGARNVSQIAADLADRFGPDVHPAPERLAAFIGQLRRQGFIDLRAPDGRLV
jgi:hypothetical protein